MMVAPDPLVQPLPPSVPRAGNRFSRWLGRSVLQLCGWRLRGELPDEKHLVICGAPHTSNWDFVFAMAAALALGIRFSYLMKREAFIWPLKGWFMRMGGIPINRAASEDLVAQMTAWYRDNKAVWLAITPEGTRAKVDKWKTGFLRIAHAAGVPVLLVAWHYPEKTLYLDRLWQPSGDHVADAAAIRDYINQKYVGGRPENQ